MNDKQPLLRRRTEEAKALRRRFGDHSGRCRFSDKEYYPGTSGVCSTITSVYKDYLICEYMEEYRQKSFETTDGRKMKYRIRRLVPRETYRLMDVDDHDIDKMLSSRVVKKEKKGVVTEEVKPYVSDSNSYKLAGNSICVCCLAGLYENLFVNTGSEANVGEQMELSFDW